MLYTIARSQHGIVVMGAVPQFELQALINVWQQQYNGQIISDSDIAQKLGYALVLGAPENIVTWRKELGLEVQTGDAEPEVAEAT